MVSVPLFALDAWMAARRVQTGFGPAVAHALLVGVELATSAVLFTTKVCTAPEAGRRQHKRKAVPTRAEGRCAGCSRGIRGGSGRLLRFAVETRADADG